MDRSQAARCLAFILSVFFASALVFPADLKAQSVADSVTQTVRNMELSAGGPVRITRSPLTGLATFLQTQPGRTIPVTGRLLTNPEERALAFIASYGMAFGLHDASQVRVTRVRTRDEVGMDHVRLQQVHNGVPVTGGELTVHLWGYGVVAVNARTLTDLKDINTVPNVSPSAALSAAGELLGKHLGVTDADLSTPRLEVFNRGILEGRSFPVRLAWFIEATKLDFREFLWVDAMTGHILLHFSQLTDALSRSIYNAHNSSTLPGTLIRSEGSPATGDIDADLAYTYSGDTYTYFFTQHGRDSYDNAGAPLVSTVHYCPSPSFCPYVNAFWNGTQMVYGDGLSRADDVDAHELTHAVTEHSANLFYYMQSGALNESYSDIFGETVDLTNSGGTDTSSVRWLLGEDIPGIGAIRNMMNPNSFGDPGKLSDTQFVCQDPGTDAGGVHSNSGVPNQAYALMVDGGNYNGFSISGIGLTKAAKIQYRTLTHYLLSASDFLDNYNGLIQSCDDLIGTAGITDADCTEVKKALDAVQMSSQWPCSPPQPVVPALCPVGQAPQWLFFDDLENPTSGTWSTSTRSGVNHWNGGSGDYGLYWTGASTSGIYHFWGYDYPSVGDSTIQMKSSVTVPAGGARLQFNHSYGFENSGATAYDGAVVEYSTNGGATWSDAGALVSGGAGYNGTISSCCNNPLQMRNAFVRDSFGYTASQLDLLSLAGQSVRFRFRIGTDSSIDDYGWFIDDVRMYTCTAPTPEIVVGQGPGGQNLVSTFNGTTGQLLDSFTTYPGSGGVSVAVGDVDGDGIADYIAGEGPGGQNRVTIYSGASGQILSTFVSFPGTSGITVTVGAVTGDGTPKIVAGQGPNGNNYYGVWDLSGKWLRGGQAYATGDGQGVSVAAGDVDGDGIDDYVVGQGPDGRNIVTIYSGATGQVLAAFNTFPGATGVSVTIGNVTGDGVKRVVAGQGPNGNNYYGVWALNGTWLRGGQAYATGDGQGVSVAAGDVDGDGIDDYVAGQGPGSGDIVTIYSGKTGQILGAFNAGMGGAGARVAIGNVVP